MGKAAGGDAGEFRVFSRTFPLPELTACSCGAGCTGETCFSCWTLHVSTSFPAEPGVLAGGAWVCGGWAGVLSSAGAGQQHLER